MRILHVIHDFLPRHRAGSEIYTSQVGRALAVDHDVTVLTSEYDPGRPHGHVSWRVEGGLPVVEIVNNWVGRSFEDTYRSERMNEQIARVLGLVQPDVVHVHNLLNLSFDLPRAAHAAGAAVVATLHDYTLVCASGGQRLHRAERHICDVIETDRCARCFRESPFYAQMAFSHAPASIAGSPVVRRLATALRGRLPRLAGRAASAVGRAANVPVTASDLDRRLEAARRVFEEIDLFVAPSRFLAAEFERLGVKAAQMRVWELGFAALGGDCTSATARVPAAATPGQPLRFGYVGTLVWHKGVHVLIDAVRRLPPGRWELVIFGDPDVSPDYTAALRKAGLGHPVRFMGAFDRDHAAQVYAQIDVLVVPSVWWENSPLVIREAQLAGVPVVGAEIGGIPELIDHGRTGWLYDPVSSSALEARLGELIEHVEAITECQRHLPPPVRTIADDARAWATTYAEIVRERRKVRVP